MNRFKNPKKLTKTVRFDRILYTYLKAKNIESLNDFMLFIKNNSKEELTLFVSEILKSNIFLLRHEFEYLIAYYSDFVKIDVTDEELKQYFDFTNKYHNQRVAESHDYFKSIEQLEEKSTNVQIHNKAKETIQEKVEKQSQNRVVDKFPKDKILYLPVFASDDIRL